MIRALLFLSLSFIILQSCEFLKPKQVEEETSELEDLVIARVYDKSLYKHEVNEYSKQGHSKIDSSQIISQYIESWIHRNLLLHNAEDKIDLDDFDIEDKVNRYREDLIIAEVKKRYAISQVSSSFTEEEITDYYQNNKESFKLNQIILKCRFIQFPNSVPELNKVKQLINSNKASDLGKLKTKCLSFSQTYNLNDSLWFDLDEIILNTPFEKIEDRVKFLIESNYYEKSDSNNTFFLKILDRKITDETPPLEFISSRIKSIILNKRRVEAIDSFEKELYSTATREEEIEIYK